MSAHDHAGHDHVPRGGLGKAFTLGVALNVAFVGVEVLYGVIAGSTALLADAGHNASDVLTLLTAWAGVALARRRPSSRFTYGLRSSSILAALFNALMLLVVVGGIAWEAVRRFAAPVPVGGVTVMVVAAAGIVVNGVSALAFRAGSKADLNVRAAFLHMVTDAAVSAGVVLAGLLILLTGRTWIDPLVSLLITGVIVWSTWSLLTESVRLSLHGVPPGIDLAALRSWLVAAPLVARIHDLHVWPMSTSETALTCHLVMPSGHPGDAFLVDLTRQLRARFGITHATLQVEVSDAVACELEGESCAPLGQPH